MRNAKVFGIGFHKTGTKSLALALEHLGYSVTGPNGVLNPNISLEVYEMAIELAREHDAFQDNPWPILYKAMDERYPGSKFILTVRPTEKWISSIVRYFGTGDTPTREWIYGVGHPKGNEAIYIERYERHNREVLDYFSDRPNDLLVLRITEGDDWAKLCRFLGKEAPLDDFPNVNKAGDKDSAKMALRRFYHKLRRSLLKSGVT